MRMLYHLNLPARDPLKSEGCEKRTRDLIDFVNKMAMDRRADISELDYISMEWVNAASHVNQILRDIRFLENSPKDEFLVKYRYVDKKNESVLQELPNDQGILNDKYKAVAMMALTDPSREPKAVCGVQSVYLRHLDEELWTVFNDHIGSVMENVPTAKLQPKQFECPRGQKVQVRKYVNDPLALSMPSDPTDDINPAHNKFSKKKVLLTLAIAAVVLISLSLACFYPFSSSDPDHPSTLIIQSKSSSPARNQRDITLLNVGASSSILSCTLRALFHLNLPTKNDSLTDFLSRMSVEGEADLRSLDAYAECGCTDPLQLAQEVFNDALEGQVDDEFLVEFSSTSFNGMKAVIEGYKAVAMISTDTTTDTALPSYCVYLRGLNEEQWIRFNDYTEEVMENIPASKIPSEAIKVILYQRIPKK